MDIVFSEESLKYRSAGHPESPERIKVALEHLRDKYEIIQPEKAEEENLSLVHEESFVNDVKEGNFSNPDCPHYRNLFYYASLSAGAAITAQKTGNFAMMRPPGHHAGRDFLGGFCYFNNLAVAVKKSGLSTLIVDFDGHHGNGTEDIFVGDDDVWYISLHRSYGFPGTGMESRDNMINHPLEVNCGDEKYMRILRNSLKRVESEEFEQLALSAGFDAHENDPLASLGLSTEAFNKIGKMLKELDLPTFAVLEGGYVDEDMGKNIDAFLQGIE